MEPGCTVTVVGAGLAGSEAAWQLAERGVSVRLFEMRPETASPAHSTSDFAELVCSNSFKSDDSATAAGHLKRELEALGSHIIRVARQHAIPAGAALAVDRFAFSQAITASLESHPRVEVIRAEVREIPDEGLVVLATGPLTSESLATDLTSLLGSGQLSFFDAASPIVELASLDDEHYFRASRYGKGGGDDYINCPLDETDYAAFYEALIAAERVERRDFEPDELFQACQPIEELARNGEGVLRFGPMKPVGLIDPRTGERPYAVIQLRSENASGTAFNLVGCQTNLTWSAQREVFSLVPALRNAEFLRYGVMHRNSFIDAPRALEQDLSLGIARDVFVAGQLAGTEGYLEAAGAGLIAALNAYARLTGRDAVVLPGTTCLGSLLAYATSPGTKKYQPMHVNFGLMPKLDPPVRGKRDRYAAYSARASRDIAAYVEERWDMFALEASGA